MKKILILVTLLAFALPSFAKTVVISTGGESEKAASYYQKGTRLAKLLNKAGKVKATVVTSSGSGENISCISDGECQVAWIQNDAMNVSKPTVPVRAKRSHSEYIWYGFNSVEKNNKEVFEDLEDLEGNKDYALVVVEDSGASYTIRNFINQAPAYGKIKLIFVDSLYDAFDLVCEGADGDQRIAGLLHVGGSLPAEIRNDFSKCVGIGQATDSAFEDAKDIFEQELYHECEIPKSLFKPLKAGGYGDQDTVCVDAMVVYPKDLDSKVLSQVKRAVNKVVR